MSTQNRSIPIEETYGCDVRGRQLGLYFYRPNASRQKWREELDAFVKKLDNIK